jgi:hypothetical protein
MQFTASIKKEEVELVLKTNLRAAYFESMEPGKHSSNFSTRTQIIPWTLFVSCFGEDGKSVLKFLGLTVTAGYIYSQIFTVFSFLEPEELQEDRPGILVED